MSYVSNLQKIWILESEYCFKLLICAFLYGSGDTKPLYYLIEYNRLDLLIAVKNKNIDDDLIREKTILFY